MSKHEFVKGALVRKKPLHKMSPIGPYMRVEMANSYYVYARSILCKDGQLLDRNLVHKVKVAQLCVSSNVAKDITRGLITTVTHTATTTWCKVVDDTPEIILFYSRDGWYKAWCTIIDAHQYRTTRGEKRVRISINRVIDRRPLL